MLEKALNCIADDLNAHFQRNRPSSDSLVKVSSLADKSGSSAAAVEEKIVLQIVALDEERNIQEPAPARGGATVAIGTGPIYLNLHVIFAATHGDYPSALQLLSDLIAYLKAKPVFDRRNTPAMPEGLRQLNFHLERLDYADLSNLWGYLGTSYLPSVNYTIRMVAVGRDQIRAAPPAIETVDLVTTR